MHCAADPLISSVSGAPSTSFEPYGKLLRMLVPSVQAVFVYGAEGECLWSSEDWEIAQVERLVSAVRAAPGAIGQKAPAAMLEFNADESGYGFAIRAGGKALGVMALMSRTAASRNGSRPLNYVQQLVEPALECLARELELRASLGVRERDLLSRESDLSLLLEMSTNKPVLGSDTDELGAVLKAGIKHLSASLAAIWVPEKGIAITITRSGQPMASSIIERMEKHLMAWMLLQQRTLLVNRISDTAFQNGATYKILACPVRHPSERVMGALVLFNPPSAPDFAEQQACVAELLAKKATAIIQAQFDASTGLMTRHAFEQHVKALDAPLGEAKHVLLYLDIDRLHVINETFGMHVGDEVIVCVAEAMLKLLPPKALSSRISGDRFAVLLPRISLDSATVAAESLRGAIAATEPRNGKARVEISVSIGIAPLSSSNNSLAHALAMAEIACKTAKDRGRNRVEQYLDSDQSMIRHQSDIMIVGTVREALKAGNLRLDAQPILPLRGSYGRPRFELLLRMIGEGGEIIPPGKFLSAAERYQLMPAIDRWVVKTACAQLGEHILGLGEDAARFAVNLSGASLQDEEFLGFVIEQIESSGIPPAILCFELTETAAIGNLEKAQQFINALATMGCQFALDDFGTGVSSLAYLKALNVSYLKIDGTFVRDALINTRSESMIKAIAQLAKVMCMETIAEYVETDALRARMADLGVDYGQGFAMGKAQPLPDLLHDLAVFEATVSTWVAPENFRAPEALAS